MRNAAYWQQRALLLKEALEAIGEDFILDLDREYKTASAAIQRDLRAWYQRFADNNGITLAQARRWLTAEELEEFRWTVEDYIKAGESLDPKWAKALENASARVHISRLEALQVQLQQTVEVLYGNQLDGLDRLLSRVYSEGYYHTLFDLQQGLGMGWNMERLSPEAIREVLSKPWTADGRTFSERIWTNRDQLVRQVQTTVTQGLMRGLSTREMGSGLQKAMGSSRYAAMRVVNTETAYFSVRAQERGFRDIGVEQYQILETLDTHTCGTCGPMDGMVLPMSQFEAGVTAPPFHPNCRGCISPYIEDLDGTRTGRDAAGNTIDVPADMTYTEWAKSFLNNGGEELLTQTPRSLTLKINFGDSKKLNTHYAKHKDKFGDISVEEYLDMANQLFRATVSEDVEEIIRSDGSVSRYRFSTNEFLVVTKDGAIRTYFKPDTGEEYWRYEHERN